MNFMAKSTVVEIAVIVAAMVWFAWRQSPWGVAACAMLAGLFTWLLVWEIEIHARLAERRRWNRELDALRRVQR